MPTLVWGIVATGNIDNKFCTDLTHCKGHRIVAVTSRQQDKALAFAKRFDIPHAYDHYPSLLQRPDVDVVYIATPHSAHYQNVVQALEAGKHVVCEKPITLTLQQAEHCVALAKQKRLFLMEAVF